MVEANTSSPSDGWRCRFRCRDLRRLPTRRPAPRRCRTFGPPLRSACSTSSARRRKSRCASALIDDLGVGHRAPQAVGAQQQAVARLQHQRADGVDHRFARLPRQVNSMLRLMRSPMGTTWLMVPAVRSRNGRACGRSACRRAPCTGASRRSAPSRPSCPAAGRPRPVVRGVSISAFCAGIAQQLVVPGDDGLAEEGHGSASVGESRWKHRRPASAAPSARRPRPRGGRPCRRPARTTGRIPACSNSPCGLRSSQRPPLRLTWYTEKTHSACGLRLRARRRGFDLAASGRSPKLSLV